MASFASSYIKTEASQVTRSVDAASMTGTNFSSWFNNSEGTIYSEAISGPNSTSVDSDGDTVGVVCFHDGTNNNRLRHATAFNNFDVRYAGSVVATITVGSYVSKTPYKSASSYKINDFQFANNGTIGTQDTSGNVPVVNQLQIGTSGITAAGGSIAGGTIKKLSYFPRRLSNAELQEMTS